MFDFAFEKNKLNRSEPNWGQKMTVPTEILKPLARSVEQFQLGDGGGPASLIAWNAQSFCSSTEQMKELVDLWFAEEKEHSRLLNDATKRFGGTPITTHWSFEIFCLVRRIFGVKFELNLLLVTELVSTVYYRLLRKYTPDEPFCDMCFLIMRDEAGHVAFHKDRMASSALDKKSKFGVIWKTYFYATGLLAGSVLWISHSKALKAVGASTKEFYRGIWLELSNFSKSLQVSIKAKKAGLEV